MFEKLALMEQKYDEISEKLSDPDIVNDNKLYTQLMKEFKNLTPIIEKYREYKKAQSSFEEIGGVKEYHIEDVLDGGVRRWIPYQGIHI